MTSIITVFLLFSAGLFAAAIDYTRCGNNVLAFCVKDFCCGTCDDRYCCNDLQKRFTEEAEKDCLLGPLRNSIKTSTPPNAPDPIPIILSILGFLAILTVFVICLVTPCCLLYKRCRNPQSLTTTVATTQFLPQLVKDGRFPQYKPLTNDPSYGDQLTPVGPLNGPLSVMGPPPSFQNAGFGIPPSYEQGQTLYANKQDQLPLPSDYSSSQPAYNPFHMEASVTTVHSVSNTC